MQLFMWGFYRKSIRERKQRRDTVNVQTPRQRSGVTWVGFQDPMCDLNGSICLRFSPLKSIFSLICKVLGCRYVLTQQLIDTSRDRRQ